MIWKPVGIVSRWRRKVVACWFMVEEVHLVLRLWNISKLKTMYVHFLRDADSIAVRMFTSQSRNQRVEQLRKWPTSQLCINHHHNSLTPSQAMRHWDRSLWPWLTFDSSCMLVLVLPTSHAYARWDVQGWKNNPYVFEKAFVSNLGYGKFIDFQNRFIVNIQLEKINAEDRI